MKGQHSKEGKGRVEGSPGERPNREGKRRQWEESQEEASIRVLQLRRQGIPSETLPDTSRPGHPRW